LHTWFRVEINNFFKEFQTGAASVGHHA